MYHDEMNKTVEWYPETVRVFIGALQRYHLKLTEQSNGTTITINKECEHTKEVTDILSHSITGAQDDGDTVGITMLGKDWALVHQLTQQFLSWKGQVLRESTAIPEALEYERGEIETARHALQVFEQMKIPRGKPIQVEFYGERVDNTPLSGNIVNIGTLNNINGQFVGVNSGTVNQSNEIEVELSKISEAITKSEISDDVRREYLADLVSINAQLAGGRPDQSFVKSAMGKLRAAIGLGGDLATLATVMLPHLDKLQHLV